ncbi:hypothetical protein BOTBODRAFT_120988 [Botryobasidium botryosum FD-172 SS1]|uniref:Uncharacterized protein n=1 Tax=Botryobasidium botryosum (strain FD-172 SS1) TaxID=930990 RepID=A0A067LUJ8_BOTB1|nr:hypothetical protein BOTBODRAFT_120988 [Botryobasidium botryosum FD-172 SS1]
MNSRFAASRRGTNSAPRASSSTVCQKCLGTGHFIFECKNPRPYASRPSRTKQLEKPEVYGQKRDQPSVEVPEEFKTKKGVADKILEEKEKERATKRVKRCVFLFSYSTPFLLSFFPPNRV